MSILSQSKRNYGVDALRIVSMIMVATLHVLGQGGVLNTSYFSPLYSNTAWLLEVAAFCAVNCYALISGYVGFQSKFKITNVFLLWLRVVFYTVLITLLFFIFAPDKLQPNCWLNAFFPVFTKQYWYITSYFGMIFFTPLINLGAKRLNKRLFTALVIILTLFYSIVPLLFNTDIFYTVGGYSVLWLLYLYVVGVYIKRFEPLNNIKSRYWLLVYLVCVLITWGFRFIPFEQNGILVNYTSITILLAGVSLLYFFKRLTFKSWQSNIIKVFAPGALSVYIIHVFYLIWENIFRDSFAFISNFPYILFVIGIILSAVAVFLICSSIDLLRQLLFDALKLKDRLYKFERKILYKK